ncbi:lysozyme inhibitor LprI family protein [Nitratireductor pacificus]|uniref:Lysozyme inhibitor LprI-like N-terminal domain-containing protein n=1 Tax=Nitratireductor pacificus pht-3B TaxID=391937 RepID=K2N3B5_9HYPH|nr:lysozyme inhibitor LprI family protein [Nitratireductor pacificus]EKF18713.1 hypothetical protein NA2_11035 [Nitratireductor pacificus pht-3B]
MTAAGPSLAQEADCRDPQTQTDMSLCAAQAYKKADEALNASYRKLTQRYGGDDDAKAGLLAAQRAWIVFRDAECDLTALGVKGGSAYPMVRAMCLEALTTERTGQLDDRLNCEEGDLSC